MIKATKAFGILDVFSVRKESVMSQKRFDVRIEQATLNTSTKIITDRETRVQYLYFEVGHGGGLCPLLDRDGKPLLAEEYRNQ